MVLLDGFYRIQFHENRYGMEGFNLAAQREFKQDKRGLGAYVMTRPTSDLRGTTWALKHLGDNKYTIQFAEDRDGMQVYMKSFHLSLSTVSTWHSTRIEFGIVDPQGYYVAARREFKKDLCDAGARLMLDEECAFRDFLPVLPPPRDIISVGPESSCWQDLVAYSS